MSRVKQMSASYYLTAVFDNCIACRQLDGCSMTRPFLSLQKVHVACETTCIPDQGSE